MELSELTWAQTAAFSRDMPVVIPVAALEQHGLHLPLFTDSLLLGEVIRRAHERLRDRVLFAPLMWLGNSEHHLDFAGTLSAAPRTYLDLLGDLAENFIAHGFRRIAFVNGHGGNIVPAAQAVFEVRQRHRRRDDMLLLAATYWALGGKPWEIDPSIRQRCMGHACEWETSMILRIAPHLVRDYRGAADVEWGERFDPASRGWITRERSAPGHIGYPRLASAEKGETLLATFSDDVVRFLEKLVAWQGTWDA